MHSGWSGIGTGVAGKGGGLKRDVGVSGGIDSKFGGERCDSAVGGLGRDVGVGGGIDSKFGGEKCDSAVEFVLR